jgi:hypothetical protein
LYVLSLAVYSVADRGCQNLPQMEIARICRRKLFLSLIFLTCQMSKKTFSAEIIFHWKYFSAETILRPNISKPSSHNTGPTTTSSSNCWNYQMASQTLNIYHTCVWLFKSILRWGWCPRFCFDSKSHAIKILKNGRPSSRRRWFNFFT